MILCKGNRTLSWPTSPTHFLYRILDSKKTSHLQFSVPGLRDIHRNLKQQNNFNSHDGFFRKSPFCTFSCINPRFGGPWGMLWIFLPFGIFIMLQKNTFSQNFFSNFMHRFKSAILAIFQCFQNGTFEPVHEIRNFYWPKVFCWSILNL